MRLRHRRSPFLLFLIPSLAASAALASSTHNTSTNSDAAAAAAPVAASDAQLSSDPSIVKKYEVGTKDAPVDGKDGRPHEGPFVEIDTLRKPTVAADPSKDLPAIKDKPSDPTIIDGKRIPDSNDGVMDDKNRPEPKQGTTGTSGGVTEKDKARKEHEGQTGKKLENKPDSPKEAPPLPHSEVEKIKGDKDVAAEEAKEKSKPDVKEADGVVIGLERPADLPDRTHDKSPPLPNSANKDHLEVTDESKSSGKPAVDDKAKDGLMHPFHSFFLSLTMILFSEIGDKTFLVAALMAMKHDRMVVFSAAFSALIAMTVLSAVVGHAVPTLIPQRVTNMLASGLFFIFGIRLLREGLSMSGDEGVSAEMQEVEMELEEKARSQGRGRKSSVSPYSLEMGMGARKSKSKSRFPAPARSPSSSPDRSPSPRRSAISGSLSGLHNLVSLVLSPAWVQTFVMTFLGEWGDRSQIATFAMAAGQDYWVVTMGAVLGHAFCTSVAVIGGRAIAGRVSLKVVTVGGAVAFLCFGLIYLIHVFY